jgi:hypothetical protein
MMLMYLYQQPPTTTRTTTSTMATTALTTTTMETMRRVTDLQESRRRGHGLEMQMRRKPPVCFFVFHSYYTSTNDYFLNRLGPRPLWYPTMSWLPNHYDDDGNDNSDDNGIKNWGDKPEGPRYVLLITFF